MMNRPGRIGRGAGDIDRSTRARPPWRTALRGADLWLSLYLLTYLFGDPLRSEFGLPYAARRHADPVMDSARERRWQAEQVRQLEAMVDVLLESTG